LNLENKFDYIIIGSGFGGSVSAMRLGEKGYSVAVMEKGRRWKASDFPKSNWNARKYLWIPLLKCFGFQKLSFFREVFVLSGVGVGGGSLVYANTHMMPRQGFYSNSVWSHFKDWKSILEPYFEKARFMLGSEKFSKEYEEDRILQSVANDMGQGSSYSRVDYVGVYLGDPKKEVDPYFSGLGPLRTGCTECAGCMVGCRHGAKNTLDKNYLWFAENLFGVKVKAETIVEKIEYLDGEYHIHTRRSTSWFGKERSVYKSTGLVVSGGVLGTLDLLLKQKYVFKTLPLLSDTLGENILTNSEMLSGVVAADRKLNHGIAISSVFNPDENTHIELCKFPDGSGAMTRLAVVAAGNGTPVVRTAKMIGNIITKPIDFLRSLFSFNLAKTSIIFLIMQSLPNSMKMKLKRRWWGSSLTFDNDSGQKVPSYIPAGQDALYRYAKKVNGVPHNAFSEVVFGLASTAHILGGCPMGKTREDGVVDDNFRVHGYDNFYILDGSIMPCNLGVNPSLTITALSEYAMDRILPKSGAKISTLQEQIELNQARNEPK
jgi:cholesterol oxidase